MGLIEFDLGQLAIGFHSEEVVPDSSVAAGRIGTEGQFLTQYSLKVPQNINFEMNRKNII